jgi:molybdopterin-guanine dinucleotide biosynthesis protein A
MPSPDLPATLLTSSALPLAPGVGIKDITALVLAGGRGARMGGVDKGLQPFHGQPLVQHALVRLAGQDGGPLHGVLVNANRNPELYLQQAEACFATGAARVVADRVQDFSGPLAGFEAGLALCSSQLLLTVPCDSPLFPLDLASRLLNALTTAQADVAVAQAIEGGPDGRPVLRSQPVFCLLKTSLHDSLAAFLASGGRKIDAWTAQHRVVHVPFNTADDDPRAFANANTLDELRSLENP